MMSDVISILLVEDDEDDYFLTSDYLENVESQQFELTWVTTPKAAFELIQKHAFDLCLADFLLAGETALDLLELFNKHRVDVPVVVLSGQTDVRIDEQVLRAGATDYLAKQDLESPKFLRSLRYAVARKEVENARLQRSKIELENKAKDRFLAHLGHELRTPLASILGYTDLLLNDERSHDIKEELSVIHNNGKHLLSLLNDLLDMSKIIANKFELSPRAIPLSGFLTDVYALMQIPAHDKGLDLIFEARTDIPVSIHADSTRLRQILINLLNNAVKFTEKGYVKLTVQILPATQTGTPSKLSFRVVDTGIGISEKDIKHIFVPFEQIEDIMRNDRGGAGLGLSICQEIASRMDGEITVKSTLGNGSEFELVFPLDDESLANLEPFSIETHQVKSIDKIEFYVSGRVLVVDDLPELRRLTSHFIRQAGAEVDFAENGEAAIHAIETAEKSNSPYHLVLMDIHMPVMTGLEAVEHLRAAQHKLPIVALTAANHKGLADELMAQGFDGVVPKPLDRSVLKSVLETFLISNRQSNDIGTIDRHEKTVCVVEDDVDAAQLMEILLMALGVEVIICNSFQALQQQLNAGVKCDLFLLDRHLPDGSANETTQFIKRYLPECPIVIVSGAETSEQQLQALGANHALLKPVSKEDLSETLSTFIALPD